MFSARISCADTDISLGLAKAGLAWHYKKYSDDPVLVRAEQQARAERVGVWSLGDPMPPWELKQGEGGTWLRAVSESTSEAAGGVHGNTSSKIYHAPSCRYYNCKNCTREFSSKAEAEKAGYRGCKICRP